MHQHGGTVAGAHHARSSRHDVPTSEVGLAGAQLSSSIVRNYGTVVFDLAFFNEVKKFDHLPSITTRYLASEYPSVNCLTSMKRY